ncbi:SurA N-terminal domain-containing protein [Saccharomonospora iraqiensis]|uniref:SurA N-terminal domain-containing protein n=1 Tax=Saccharomonospora iraqiensis TaxID=52698 RepID=UPI00047BFF38|nr:SurA N-terminal domain-containing protein [Saccharomonospora iraqiensis]
MIRTIRRPVALALVLLTATVLTACGSGPSRADSAALVGDRSIGLDSVQAEIRWLLDNVEQAEQAQEQNKLDQFGREVVRSRVVHELVTVAAEREGLEVDPREVDRLIHDNGGVRAIARSTFSEPSRVRGVVRDQLLLQQLTERYRDRLSVRMVGAMVTESSVEATAERTARDLGERIARNPDEAERIIAENGHQPVTEELTLGRTLDRDPELATTAVFGAGEGTVVVIQPSRQRVGWLVALVRDRTVGAPGSGESAAREDGAGQAQQVNPQLRYLAGLRQLQPIAEELGVRINPRYGVWDGAALAPAPSDEELTGYLLESRTVRP